MPRLEVTVSATVLVIFVGMSVLASGYPAEARFVPLVVAIPAAVLAAWQLSRDVKAAVSSDTAPAAALRLAAEEATAIKWLVGFTVLVLAGGFVVGGTLAVVLCQRLWLRESWRTAVLTGAVAWTLLVVCFERLLGLVLYEGWLVEWIR